MLGLSMSSTSPVAPMLKNGAVVPERAPADAEQCRRLAIVDDGTAFEIGRRAAERPHEADDSHRFAGRHVREPQRARGDLVVGGIRVLRRRDAGAAEVEQIDAEPVDAAQVEIDLPGHGGVDGAVQVRRQHSDAAVGRVERRGCRVGCGLGQRAEGDDVLTDRQRARVEQRCRTRRSSALSCSARR